MGVLPGEGAASGPEAPRFINNTNAWSIKSTDASHPLLSYFKQPCQVGWSGFLILTLHIRQLRSRNSRWLVQGHSGSWMCRQEGCKGGPVEAVCCGEFGEKFVSSPCVPLYPVTPQRGKRGVRRCLIGLSSHFDLPRSPGGPTPTPGKMRRHTLLNHCQSSATRQMSRPSVEPSNPVSP